MDPGTALLDAVYDAPHDDAPRLVYADWLQDRGDPRGEFIMMQYRTPRTPAQVAREAELLDRHGEDWQGRLREITTWVEFENGFLARCGLRRIPDWAVGRREWATVQHVGISDDWNRDLAKLITHAAMRSLASIRVPSRAVAVMFGTREASPVRHMIVDGALSADSWRALPESPLFEHLVSLDLKTNAFDVPAIFGSSLAARLESVVCTPNKWKLELARGADGRLSAMAARSEALDPRHAGSTDWLANLLDALPADALTALELALPRGAPVVRLRSSIGRQRRLTNPPTL